MRHLNIQQHELPVQHARVGEVGGEQSRELAARCCFSPLCVFFWYLSQNIQRSHYFLSVFFRE